MASVPHAVPSMIPLPVCRWRGGDAPCHTCASTKWATKGACAPCEQCPWPNHEPVSHQQQPTMPSIPQRIRNFLTAKAKWVAAGRPVVNEETHAARRAACDACPKRNAEKDACTLCGCPLHPTPLGDKLRMATAECPDNPPRWKAIV